MNDTVMVAVIAGPAAIVVGAITNWWLNRVRSSVDTDVVVSNQWRDWAAEQGRRIDKLEQRVSDLENALDDEKETSAGLRVELERQQHVFQSLARWAIKLRDELVRAGGTVPQMPVDVEAALTTVGGSKGV